MTLHHNQLFMRDLFKVILRTILLVLLAMLCIAPVKSQTPQHQRMFGTLVHHVFFWLEEPDNPRTRAQFESAIENLLQVETIRRSHFGVPAATEDREVVDHTYTYSLILFFESKEDQDAYQAHPIHLKFVEENRHLWKKVRVYDSSDF